LASRIKTTMTEWTLVPRDEMRVEQDAAHQATITQGRERLCLQ
jgi:hypothetical protein